MKGRKKLNKEHLVVIVILTAAIWSLWFGRVMLTAEASSKKQARDTHVLTYYDTRYHDATHVVGYFEIDGGITAMCVCHELEPPRQIGTPLTTIACYTAENQGNELLRKVYYYGWNGPGDQGASFTETCLAGSIANGHNDGFGYGQEFLDRIEGLPGAPKGFDVYILSDGVNTTQNLAYWDYQPIGYVTLQKGSEKPEIVENNSCYSLRNAEYGVYSDEACVNQAGTLITDSDGKTDTLELDTGDYYIKEKKAPDGYQLDRTVYPITIAEQETSTVETADMPVWDSLGFSIYKQDAERKEGRPLGAGALDGAEFTVCFYAGYYDLDNLPEEPDRVWILETRKDEEEESQYSCKLDEEYKLGGDAFYQVEGQTVLPLGTITVEETKAPKGYLLEGVWYQNDADERQEAKYLTQIRQNENLAEIRGGNRCVASDYVIRGDLELVKIGDGTHKRLAGVPFQITSNTTGESHVILTDENGQASTAAGWNPHTGRTNMGESAEDGVWFGMKTDGTLVEPEDARGALPFDTYTVEELSCEANQNYELIPPFTVTIKKDKTTVHLGTVTNDEPQEETPQEPKTPEKRKKSSQNVPVRTGDGANMSIWLFTCILSCVVIITCVMIARRMKKR